MRPFEPSAVVIGVSVVASLVLARPALAQGERVGVIDVGRVFGHYVRAKQLEKDINGEKDQLEKRIDAQRELIVKLRKEAEWLDGPALAMKDDEIQIEIARLRLMKQRSEQRLKSRFEEYTTRILGEIAEVVADYGRDHRFSLILKVDSQKSWGEDRLQAALRSVIYHSDSVDITATILEILNGPDWLETMAQRDREGEGLGK